MNYVEPGLRSAGISNATAVINIAKLADHVIYSSNSKSSKFTASNARQDNVV